MFTDQNPDLHESFEDTGQNSLVDVFDQQQQTPAC